MIRSFLVVSPFLSAFPLSSQSTSDNLSAARFASPDSAKGCASAFWSLADNQTHGFDLSNLDRSVAPCDNFFEFADGWIKANAIPADYSSWGAF